MAATLRQVTIGLTRQIVIGRGRRKAGSTSSKTYPATLSTEAPVTRQDWDRGAYDEILSHKPGAVDLSRAPLPLLESHDHGSLPIGIVENVRIVDGKLRGDVSFGASARAQEVAADVDGGIIRNLSVGYSIETFEERQEGARKVITATRWTPHELSAVAIGADAGAGFGRSRPMDENETDIDELDENEPEDDDSDELDEDEAPKRKAKGTAEEERARCAEIARLGRALGLPVSFQERHIRAGTSLTKVRDAAVDAAERRRKPIISDAGRADFLGGGYGRRGSGANSGDDFRAAAVDAILGRAGVNLGKRHPAAGDVDGSVLEIARTCISRAGKTVHGSSPELIVRGAQSTSDFPLILGDVMHKATRHGYEQEPASHRQWVRTQEVPDFRDQHRPILGSAPDLEQVNEGGEYHHGALDEDSTSYRVYKFGKIVSLTWEALVNDNLSAFVRIQPSMGQAARRKEADTVYDLLAENSNLGPTMQDNVVLFHVDHGNLATSGAFNAATLGAARALLRKQTAVGGGYMSLVPRFMIVPAELETSAEILLASATRVLTSTTEADTPQWIAQLALIVEPRLPTGALYLAADSAQIDTVELGLLSENIGGPFLEEEREFSRDVYRWKVRHVFGAKVLDWRGLVKVPIA